MAGDEPKPKHHCPTCHKTARTGCIDKGHLKTCGQCQVNYSLFYNPHGCPRYADTADKIAKRQAKEAKERDKKENKKKASEKEN